MFDKPNTAGFLHVSHYLLMIHDAERFKKLVEWPVTCKQTETKYRNVIKAYLNTIVLENPDMGFPHVLTSYLLRASGIKFITIMWKLSQLTLKTYIMSDGIQQILFAPKLSLASDLVKTYLEQSKANATCNILSCHQNFVQLEKVAKFTLEEQQKHLSTVKTELFDKKQSLKKFVSTVPVAEPIKKRLINVEDTEVISLWKKSLDKNIQYIQKLNSELKDLEKVCENINNMISRLLNDTKALDTKQLEKLNCSLLSELSCPPDIEYYFYHLYNDNKLVYHNFVHLFTSVLYQIYQCLKENDLVDLSQCLLHVEANAEDMTSMHNMFKTFLDSINEKIHFTKKTQNILCEKNKELVSNENVVPFLNSVLLMPSPLIKIKTNCTDEKNDTQLLQFTPGEITHKSLFSRFASQSQFPSRVQPNQNYTPNLKTNLFRSRLNLDSTILDNTTANSNEKQGLNMRFRSCKIKEFHESAEKKKYSRLFSFSHAHKNRKANSSMMSMSSVAQASSVTNTVEKMSNSSDFDLNTIAKSFFNCEESLGAYSSEQFTSIKRNVSQVKSQQQARNKFERKIEIKTIEELDKFTDVQLVNDENKDTVVKHENVPGRRSFSDLIKRYKKLLEVSNSNAQLEK
ncbi:hypothetical protein PUN28_019297 [Cardiocondyla obscurior]